MIDMKNLLNERGRFITMQTVGEGMTIHKSSLQDNVGDPSLRSG
jgi:hypothetical protein